MSTTNLASAAHSRDPSYNLAKSKSNQSINKC